MDCILLTGNGESYRSVGGKELKAFLEVDGKSILERMLLQLAQVPMIEHLFLVGPKQLLERHIAPFNHPNKAQNLTILEQRSDIIENIQFALSQIAESKGGQDPVLVLPSDLPLLTAEEVISFIEQCDTSQFDYFGGLTTEKALSRFYPTCQLPGIQMAYFHFHQGLFRINNLHLVRPSALNGMDYLRKTFAMRYQKKWTNILRMMFYLATISFKTPAAIPYYIGMQFTRLLAENKVTKISNFTKNFLNTRKCEEMISIILGTRFKLVTTNFGGTAVDIDNDKDYQTLLVRFREWSSAIQESITQEKNKKNQIYSHKSDME